MIGKKALIILHLVTGTLNERLVYMKAVRHASLNMSRFPGLKNNDVYFQMIDLDKGVYGHAFLVSLFLHVSTIQESIWFLDLKIMKIFVRFQNQSREERTIKITMLCNSVYYNGKKAHQIKQGNY